MDIVYKSEAQILGMCITENIKSGVMQGKRVDVWFMFRI